LSEAAGVVIHQSLTWIPAKCEDKTCIWCIQSIGREKEYRSNITDKLLELAVSKGRIVRDGRWADAYNALISAPSSGRMLKVVYRRIGSESYKIITAYWLD